MPYLVTCPNCSAKLKSAQPVPAGRALNCPQCKTSFTLSEPAPEIEVGAATTEAPKPAAAGSPRVVAPAPAAFPAPPAPPSPPSPSVPPTRSPIILESPAPRTGRKAFEEEISEAEIVDAADFDRKARPQNRDHDIDRPRSRRREDDELDYDRPRSRRHEEDESDYDRPRSRRRDAEDDDDRRPTRGRDDDEDDRPRSRRRDEDQSDYDRPRSRRRDDEDDDDRRPIRRRDDDEPRNRRSRDDDDDDRPTPRKDRDRRDEDDDDESPKSIVRSPYRNRKKGNRTLLIALLGGGAAVLLITFIVLLLVIDPFGIFGGGAPSEMLAFAPADTQAITVINMNEARGVDDFRTGFVGNADGARLGIKAEEIDKAMTASKTGGLFGIFGGEPEVVVFKLNSTADQQRIISSVGGKEATASGKKYYKTNAGGGLYFPSSRLVVFTKKESTMIPLLEKSDSRVIVSDEMRSAAGRANGTVATACIGQAAEGSDLLGLMAGQGGIFGPGIGGVGPVRSAKAKTVIFSSKVSGSRGTAKFQSTYDSSDTARRIADDVRKNLESNRGRMTELESWDVSYSGSTVTLTLTGTVKNKGGFLPFGK